MPKATSAFAHSYLQHSLARHELFYTTDINNTADHGNDYPIHSLPKDQLLAEKKWINNDLYVCNGGLSTPCISLATAPHLHHSSTCMWENQCHSWQRSAIYIPVVCQKAQLSVFLKICNFATKPISELILLMSCRESHLVNSKRLHASYCRNPRTDHDGVFNGSIINSSLCNLVNQMAPAQTRSQLIKQHYH